LFCRIPHYGKEEFEIPLTVKDVFQKGFVSVNGNDTLSACLSLFKEGTPPVLAVLNDEGKFQGVLSRRWIIRSRLDPSVTKVKTLMRAAPAVTLQDSLSKAARLIIESDIRQLPVYNTEGGVLVGFVTEEDIIHGFVMEEWGKGKVEEIMTKDPFVVEEDDSVGSVMSLFREHGISHAIVVKDRKLVGIVSIHDIIEHIFQPGRRQTLGDRVGTKIRTLSIPVKGIMTAPVFTVTPEAILRDVDQRMHEHDISSMVVTVRDRPVGIVTKRDFLEPIAQMETPRLRFTVQFSVKDVELDDIEQGFIMDEFESFIRRYEETLEAGTLFVYMKTHGTNYKGNQLIHCRLQLRTRKGSFFSASEGWVTEQTFRIGLDRLERQILKSKELEYNPELATRYLLETRFPFSEL